MQKTDKKPHDDKSKAKESKATPNDKFFAGIQSSVDVFFDPEREVPRFVKTGFQSLDTALGGGIANGLTILGAKPGSGKTSLVHQIAEHISSAEIPVLYFSLEMSREQINAKSMNRNLWRELEKPENQRDQKKFQGVTSRNFIFNNLPNINLSDTEAKEPGKKLIKKAAEEANKRLKHFYVVEPGTLIDGSVFGGRIAEIRAVIEKFIDFCGSKQPLVIIDYLQIVGTDREYATERQSVDAVIHELFPIKTKIPIILISSLNRGSYTAENEAKSVNMIGMGSFKESGNIEFSAEVLIGMQDISENEDTEPRKISLKLLKHRYGRPGSEVLLFYNRKHDLFEETPNRFDGAVGVTEQEIEQDRLWNQFMNATGKMKKKEWVPDWK